MSSYYIPSKGAVNRYWKRPKPRIYECNIRDSERFYQQSYKDYLEAKEYAAKKAAEDRSRIGEDTASRWGIRRSNSLMESSSDPVSRDYTSFDGNARGSLLTSSSRQYGDDSYSGSQSLRSTSMSGRRSPNSDMSTIEDRLERLQKLRSELGLPAESSGATSSRVATSGTSQKVTFNVPNSPTTASTISFRNTSPEPRGRRGKTVDVSSSYSSSTRSANRSRGSDLTSDSYMDKAVNGNEKISKYSSKYSNVDDDYSAIETRPRRSNRASSYTTEDSDNKYSFKSSLKSGRKYDADTDDSYSFKPSNSKKGDDSSTSFKSTRKAVTINDDDDCDADAYLSSIKKKFPTSDEILERIKKMDSDM